MKPPSSKSKTTGETPVPRAPRDNSKLIETTVEGPDKGEKGKSATLHLLTGLAPIEQLVADIRSDHAQFENHSKMAAFLALRIGLRLVWVKNNGSHGCLDPFMKEHFPAISRRSLFNYIRIADAFVSDASLRDKKTHKLTDSKAPKAILSQQLELFTDPKAKLDIHCKQLVEWVNGRGLTQIYRDLSEEEDLTAKLPPAPKKGQKKDKKTPEQVKREAFSDALTVFKAAFMSGNWKQLFDKDRHGLEAWLTKSGQKVKEHNAEVAQEARKRK